MSQILLFLLLLWRILTTRPPKLPDGTPLSQVLVLQPPQSRLPSIRQCPASISFWVSLCPSYPHMCPPRIVFPMCYAVECGQSMIIFVSGLGSKVVGLLSLAVQGHSHLFFSQSISTEDKNAKVNTFNYE